MPAQKLQSFIDQAQFIVFFGGAGVSTESGIPDFRSVDGLYHQKYDYPPETILSHSFFLKHPDIFYQFYKEKMIHTSAQPNITHRVLAKLEQLGKLDAVVTQNIDGLHQLAQSKVVHELHGSIHRNYCMHCHTSYPLQKIIDSTELPTCSCGGLIKPDVTLYEESLNPRTVEAAISAIQNADLLIIGGTSLKVYPAANFINYFKGQHIVVINREDLHLSQVSLSINENLGDIFSQITI